MQNIGRFAGTCSKNWPFGIDGDLNISSGTTTLTAGGIYDFRSIYIGSGGTLKISDSDNPSITIIGCRYNFQNDGTIVGSLGNYSTQTYTLSNVPGFESFGSLSYTCTQQNGGNGGTVSLTNTNLQANSTNITITGTYLI